MTRRILSEYWLFLILLIFSSFYSFKYLNQNTVMYLQWAVIGCFIVYSLGSHLLFSRDLYLKKYILYFTIFPWFSVIPSIISHGQTLYQSAFALSTISLVFLFYFALLKLKISEEDLLKIIIVFSLFYVFLELFQQITYPTYWFAGKEDSEGEVFERLGLYKFYMTGIHLVVLALFYSWGQFLKRFTLKSFILFFILTIGLYAFLARKFDFAFLLCIVISFFIEKRIKWYYWLLIISFLFLLVSNASIIFGDFIANTKTEISNPDFIRYQSTIYFLNYFDDPLCLWLGNGREYGASDYGRFIQFVQDNFHFYRADIGIFSYFNLHGIIGSIPILLFVWFLWKRWSLLPLYLKLYFIFNGVMLSMAFPLNSINGAITFTIVLYLMELHFRDNVAYSNSWQ